MLSLYFYVNQEAVVEIFLATTSQEMSSSVSKEELRGFLRALGEERETFRLSEREVLESVILIGMRRSHKVIGIAGVRKRFGLPVVFVAVKSEYQGLGVGGRLLNNLHDIMREKCHFLLLSMVTRNVPAVRLFESHGYQKFYSTEDRSCMIKSFTAIGTLFAIFLRILFLPVSELGNLIKKK